MTPHFIFLDGEMGGIGIEFSLLTISFLITDKNFNTLDELNLKLKPDVGGYIVTGEALGINHINLVEHDKDAIPYKKGGTILYNFLKKNSNNGSIKLISVGHGYSVDLDQIWDKLIGRPTWETFVSYRRLDTSVALQFLKMCGMFPDTVSGSLESLCKHFNINNGTLHDAKTDALNTRDVLKELIKMTEPPAVWG